MTHFEIEPAIKPTSNSLLVNQKGFRLGVFDVGAKPGEAVRRESTWLADRPRIVYTNTLGTVNGVDYLARVTTTANKIYPERRFAIPSYGREEVAVRKRAAQAGILDQNFFRTGTIPKRQLPQWLTAATIATSIFIDNKITWTSSANKFFDTMAAGKPLAINYGDWQADLLKKLAAGLVLDPHDTETAAASLVRTARDRDWLAWAGHAATKLAKERFDCGRLADQLEQISARTDR